MMWIVLNVIIVGCKDPMPPYYLLINISFLFRKLPIFHMAKHTHTHTRTHARTHTDTHARKQTGRIHYTYAYCILMLEEIVNAISCTSQLRIIMNTKHGCHNVWYLIQV